MLAVNCYGLNVAISSSALAAFQRPSVLGMMWQCDVCHTGNICDVSRETHFFAVILTVRRDHENVSPSCEWNPTNIHGLSFHRQ
jgi:hypothetical protein